MGNGAGDSRRGQIARMSGQSKGVWSPCRQWGRCSKATAGFWNLNQGYKDRRPYGETTAMVPNTEGRSLS